MKYRNISKVVSLLAAGLLASSMASAQKVVPVGELEEYGAPFGQPVDKNEILLTHVFDNNDTEFTKYRIPGMVVTKKGTILAFCEGRNGEGGDADEIAMVLRRSTDNGRTWSQQSIVWRDKINTCGNPCPVVDQETGRIILVMTWNPGKTSKNYSERWMRKQRYPYVCYSDDDGLTWSEPENISETGKDPSWNWYATGPGFGIQLKSERFKNRIVIPCNHSFDSGDPEQYVDFIKGGLGCHVLLSDDGGKTWRHSETIRPKCNESQVIELGDGSLMMNMRSYFGTHCRAVSYSYDGGETWTDPQDAYQLVDPVCQASIIKYGEYKGRQMYLFCNPGGAQKRMNLSVKVSFDECQTWTNTKMICPNKTEYSCLAVLPNGNIGILFEVGRVEQDWEDKGLMFVSFHPDQLFEPGAIMSDNQIPE